jgi:hypothetical protein
MTEKLFEELCLRKTGYLEACEESYDDPKVLEKYKIKMEELEHVISIIFNYMK